MIDSLRNSCVVACVAWWLLAGNAAAELNRYHRRPIACVEADDGTLLIANHRSGTISRVNVAAVGSKMSHRVREYNIGQQLADLKYIADNRFVTIDEAQHEVIMLALTADGLDVVSRTPVSPYPVSIQVDPVQQQITVCSLWSRTFSVLKLNQSGQPLKVIASLSLSFSPRKHTLLSEHNKAVVADAFGGKLAVIDLDQPIVESVRELPAHNIRHLVYQPGDSTIIDGKPTKPPQITLSHQFGNQLSRPTQDDIHWGMFLNNGLRTLQLDVVLNPKQRLLKNSRFEALGDIGRGAGDPSGFVFKDSKYAIAALSGVNDVIVAPTNQEPSFRIDVGRRPTDVTLLRDGRVCVLNSLSDSISVLDVAERTPDDQPQEAQGRSDERIEVFDKLVVRTQTVSLGPSPKLTDADKGERLFFNAKLSHDTWFSCHSCHTDGHSNGQLADTLTDGDYGAAKRVLSLRGVGETGPWAWNGKMKTLGDQMHKSVHSTMQGPEITNRQAAQLVAFLQTFQPLPTMAKTNPHRADLSRIARGKAIFTTRGCVKCHAGNTHTSPQTYDVGLKDELGTNRFNPPSLRGVRFREQLFHDARAKSLNDVIEKFAHQLSEPLESNEVEDLIAYLNNL